MAYVRSTIGSGGGGGSVKDIIREKALNGGFSTTYNIISHNSRCTVNEGQLSIDTDNKIVYLYADFTMLTNVGSGSDFYGVAKTSSQVPSSYCQKNQSGGTVTSFEITNDETATQKRCLFVQNYSSSTFIATGYGVIFNTGENHKVYEMWSYL